jgi:hypothetical protein
MRASPPGLRAWHIHGSRFTNRMCVAQRSGCAKPKDPRMRQRYECPRLRAPVVRALRPLNSVVDSGSCVHTDTPGSLPTSTTT